MNRDISEFLIDTNTDTPISDIIKVSKVFDSLNCTDNSSINERYILKHAYLRDSGAIEDGEERLVNIINWFNTNIIKIFLESLDDETFQTLQCRLTNGSQEDWSRSALQELSVYF